MALIKQYSDSSGNDYPASYWRAVRIDIRALEGTIYVEFWGWRDADAYAAGLRPIQDAIRPYVVQGADFLTVAGSPVVGSTLYDVLANAAEDYALASSDLNGESFFAGATQV